jgi:hypothetical protein
MPSRKRAGLTSVEYILVLVLIVVAAAGIWMAVSTAVAGGVQTFTHTFDNAVSPTAVGAATSPTATITFT